MKTVLTLILILASLSSWGLTRPEIERLLKEKNVSLQQLERGGAQVILGEVTGHNHALPFSKIQVLLTDHEAILKTEIDSVEFKGPAVLNNVHTFRFNGQYILRQEVKAIIIKAQ